MSVWASYSEEAIISRGLHVLVQIYEIFPSTILTPIERQQNFPKLYVFVSYSWTYLNSLFTGQGYGSIIPDALDVDSHELTLGLAEKVGKYVDQYMESMEKVFKKNWTSYFVTFSL